MTTRKRNRSTVTCCTALHMEWDRITCPICMEQPHNAVLLICSSYENGCRCYICNTSHRHSNCLDRFRKMNGGSKVRASHSAFSVLSNSDNRTVQPRAHYGMISRPSRSPRSTGRFDHRGSYSYNVSSGQNTASFSQPRNENHHGDSASSALAMGEGSITMEECDGVTQGSNSLKCPFCRGTVSGWIPAEELRQYLDQKLRTCSHDTCKFVGNYEQLREHARSVHTLMRPVHVDQARQRAWNRLEREWEHGDVISAIRTEMPGAMVVGDYVIETPDTFTPDFVESDEEGWSPAEDPVGSPDDRHDTPGLWPNFRQGSSSTGPDERQGPPSFLPQNRPEPSRLRLDDRRSSPTVLQDRRPSWNYSQWRQINVGRRSRYLRQWHQNPSYQPYAGSRGGTGLIREIYDRALVPRRRQRLRYTSRARYHQ